MKTKYDYVIVGSGLFGAVFAYKMNQAGHKCLVIDKRDHQGGNIYCENVEGINVHKYGPHIFHTNSKEVWDFVNQFVEFNHFRYSPLANYKGTLYNLPFNMHTFYQFWGTQTPEEAKQKIEEQKAELNIKKPQNLEEQAISLVGNDVYERLIKGYTEKQWGRNAKDLPSFIIKRLPVRYTYDNNYFNDKYQGIPIGGYNKLIDGLLEGIDVQLNTDYFENKSSFDEMGTKVVYTGKIDEFFDYQLGYLNYRSLRFESETLDKANHQGIAAINYTEREVPYTRIIEHKHFEYGTQDKTVITKEYPQEWDKDKEPYYPVNDETNSSLYNRYKKLAEAENNVIFGGRLAEYKYYDMHQVIASALKRAEKELGL
ncbi:UDP-galactopyranose mutase [Flammeovirga yaeyamensis]|uniref:UDP-galactopyranose mutase n=1 Tax=Flammeovirga yaeyamensis TaxID=367791 RepID=A0AAX1N489_9BACT|nr:UDP-galactopyranose mutase [Flammeovirga yaeyamensis]MBB3701446.1 UDP-galactopyranose mutase [Flammeovirga yaeyamensis]NMF38522.1 UDP-galactopyranose mutase [Flammeovirga yaeyamensis]QWG02398.1 UDP-galactopyranose mutase [Flammeovirga yaeyamensis]